MKPATPLCPPKFQATPRRRAFFHLAETLATALADTAPTPRGLNQRHPDFAAFAVRIGRAIGREAETVAATESRRSGQIRFSVWKMTPSARPCSPTLRTAESFTGTAGELAPNLVEMDRELPP